jgi:hypothetical protein
MVAPASSSKGALTCARRSASGYVVEQIADREAMLARRKEILAQRPEIKFARELGPIMGEYEREYWRWCIETMELERSRLTYTEVHRDQEER